MDIQLREIIQVSNNSIVTNHLLHKLNEKFDDNDKLIFREWLKIVSNNNQNQLHVARRVSGKYLRH